MLRLWENSSNILMKENTKEVICISLFILSSPFASACLNRNVTKLWGTVTAFIYTIQLLLQQIQCFKRS